MNELLIIVAILAILWLLNFLISYGRAGAILLIEVAMLLLASMGVYFSLKEVIGANMIATALIATLLFIAGIVALVIYSREGLG